MQTPTHLLVAAAVLARPDDRRRNLGLLAGAILPDLSIYVLFVWSKLAGIPERLVWREIYWQDPWQTLSAISNSVPLWLVLLAVGLVARLRLLWIFATAGLLHLALDFPVHNDDAHKHFWPFTDWRFHSPFSYWDREHYGNIVSLAEIALGAACIVLLWRRFTSHTVRGILALAAVAYAAVPLYFRLMLG